MGIVHPAIYRDYVKSPMARSSGAVTPENRIEKLPAAVEHRSGAVRHFAAGHNLAYSVGDAERKLDYFVGSGAVGRSYLSSIDGFLFQAPVSWYSAASKWGLSPGFEKSPELNLLRAIERGCLRCHASGLQPIEGSVNGYRTPAFLEGGVSCERSHRPGDTHAARGKGGIVNPSKLDPVRRDSVCAQCHLSGATEISRGPGAAAFRAGEVLADKSVTFVWSSGDGPMPVISHFERMAQSR